MSRIMQVIDKKTDFSKGTVDLKLYQTGFVTLTKVITSVAGQTVDNAVSGANVGFQFFHDLNTKQLAVRNYVDKYRSKYNAEIATKKKTVTNLIDFSYNWKSCVDYRSQIVSGDKADYRLFQKVVNAEKELYDYRLYASDHIKRNCEIMANWSKTRNYGSNVKRIETNEFRSNSYLYYSINKSSSYCSIRPAYNEGYAHRVVIDGLDKIPSGTTDSAVIKIRKADGSYALWSYAVTKRSLGTTQDDGFFDGTVAVTVLQDTDLRIYAWSGTTGVKAINNVASLHFTKSSGVYDLEFFKTRKLI